LVETFPTVIPRFCIVTTLIVSRDDYPKRISVRPVFDRQPLPPVEISSDEIAQWAAQVQPELDAEVEEFPAEDPPKSRIIIEMILSPWMVAAVGRLSVHVETDHGAIRAGSIKVTKGSRLLGADN
jgi:hypothetical protein